MKTSLTRLAAATAVALLATQANAAVLTASSAGGSNVLLTLVNTGNSASITQNLGIQKAGVDPGDLFNLDNDVVQFIADAGGAANVAFSLIAGISTSSANPAEYLHSSSNSAFTVPGTYLNGVGRGIWFNSFNTYVTRLNTATDGDGDETYGAFASGAQPNYLTVGTNDWGNAGVNPYVNMAAGTADLFLYTVNFGSANGVAPTSAELFADARASLNLASGKLVISSVVPVPAAAWLFGSALGLAGVLRRRVTA